MNNYALKWSSLFGFNLVNFLWVAVLFWMVGGGLNSSPVSIVLGSISMLPGKFPKTSAHRTGILY